ncbi:MAG: response regulator [Methanospirillaceae archaeon]|nr:response regulator [Methanospirillaceae archaeon]
MTTILYVDDIAVLTQLFATGLSEAGYDTMTATSGKECLTLLETVTPDILILDIMMEPLDGWNVLLQVRKKDPDHTILIVMLTAKALSPEDIMEYGDLFDGYIMKPLTIEKLLMHVSWYCERLTDIRGEIASAAETEKTREEIRNEHILRIRIHSWENLIESYKKRLRSPEITYLSSNEFEQDVVMLEEHLKDLKESLCNLTSVTDDKSV